MENPKTWNNVQHLINKTIAEYEKNTANGLIGLSLPSTIFNALRDAHMIKEEFYMVAEQKPKAIVMTEEGLPTTKMGEIGKDENGKAVVSDGNGKITGRQG